MRRRDFVTNTIFGTIAGISAQSARAERLAGSLDTLSKTRGLRFGVAVSAKTMEQPAYADLVLHHAGLLVAENAMKWQYLEPQERVISDHEAAWFARLGAAHNKPMRGHCFLWNHHDRMPVWLVDIAAATARGAVRDLTRHMWRHGAYLARRFGGVESWDAMNEVIDPATGEIRETHFTRAIGNRFFDLAFQIMGEKFPAARLALNETMSWDTDPRHRDGVLRLLERARQRDLPLHTLGIQSHIGKTLGRARDERGWRDFLQAVSDMGFAIAITEFDCSDRNIAASDPAIRDAEVAAHCRAYLDLTLDFTNVRDVVVWSLGDGASYMNRPGYPQWGRRADGLALRGHPFDDQLRPKPMFSAIEAALRAAPMR